MIEHSSPTLTLPVTDRDQMQGSASAAVTLVEYGDFECPHCGDAFPIVEKLRQQQGDNLCFVFRHFPMTESHLNAQHSAEGAEAAGAKDLFWQMHQLLFENQSALSLEDLAGYAARLGIDDAWFKGTLGEHTFANRVREDYMSGVKSGVNGTPAFFINGVRHDGAATLAALTAAVSEQAKSVGKRHRKARR